MTIVTRRGTLIVKSRYFRLGCGAVFNFVAFVLSYYGPASPIPGLSFFRDISILLALVPVAGLALAVTAIATLMHTRNRESVFLLVAGCVLIASATGGALLGQHLRMEAFGNLSVRSQSLIAAIKEYELRKGLPPTSLRDLVPEFLPSIPATGMSAYRTYEYLAGPTAQAYEGNPWVLVVNCGGPGFNFDRFLYFPRQNYPERGYGGTVERIADWAYVHE